MSSADWWLAVGDERRKKILRVLAGGRDRSDTLHTISQAVGLAGRQGAKLHIDTMRKSGDVEPDSLRLTDAGLARAAGLGYNTLTARERQLVELYRGNIGVADLPADIQITINRQRRDGAEA